MRRLHKICRKPGIIGQHIRGGPAPDCESAFHIAKLASNFWIGIVSLFENNFCIAKIVAYLFEIYRKNMSYVLYKTMFEWRYYLVMPLASKT